MKVLVYDGYGWSEADVRNGSLADYYETIGGGCNMVEIHIWAFGRQDGKPVGVILDEEGKLSGKDVSGLLMMTLRNGRQEVMDVLVGRLIVTGVTRDGDLRGLTKREIDSITRSAGPVFYY